MSYSFCEICCKVRENPHHCGQELAKEEVVTLKAANQQLRTLAGNLGGKVREECGEPKEGKTHCRDCWQHGCPVYIYLNDKVVRDG